ncbi:MAG: murein hydrolase activator EnvC [Bacteriovoracaceae bacterium]
MRNILFLSLLVCSIESSYSAIKGRGDDLTKYRSEVVQLGAKLTTLEKEIGSKNNLYLSSIEQIKQFEIDVHHYREKLKEIHKHVKEAQRENKRILQSYLLESNNESLEPWQRKVHLELLKQAQIKLKNKENELISFENKVAEFDLKLAELRRNEEELSEVIKELNERKKIAMELYMAKVQDKKKIESEIQKQKINTKLAEVKKEFSKAPIIEARPDRIFSRPVDDFLSFTPSPKGVTFKYQSIQPVKATGEGKVVFAGDLASYGQVVLIDHGNDLRSVILGKMNIRVKKNDSVKDGDVLAYTMNDTKEAQNLYFEIRKKNTAQNTILWLDQNGVSKI